MNRERLIEGIWERDATTWTGSDEGKWLGWLDEARQLFDELASAGVDVDDVTRVLEEEGVQKFAESFAELMEGVRSKRGELAAA